ncbi:MAG: aminotransferase class I/II-fold pyridoxal phosphate-dependent enzyme, partial [Myxococcota bacterium]
MYIAPFSTEDFFARYELDAPHMLSASDCEHITVAELCRLAGVELDTFGHIPLQYTEASGGAGLRSAIAATHERVNPGHILMLNAPQEGIFLTMHALLNPGDDVVTLSPCYDSLTQVAEHIGCTVHRWALLPSEDDSRWTIDWETLDELLSLKPRMVILNIPHNPTGFFPDLHTWRRLLHR